MSFEYFIGGRYLRAKQKETFISLITILSIAGVTVGRNGVDRCYCCNGRL